MPGLSTESAGANSSFESRRAGARRGAGTAPGAGRFTDMKAMPTTDRTRAPGLYDEQLQRLLQEKWLLSGDGAPPLAIIKAFFPTTPTLER